MNEIINSLLTRRSVRSFADEQITDEELETVLEVGKYAPTAMNRQSPIMVVLQNKADIEQVEKLNAAVMGREGTNPFYGAPTVIIVFADRNIPTYRDDGSLVMGNLLNAAHAVGLGSCWINRAREVFASAQGRALMQKWNIPENYEGIGNCILGYVKGDYPQAKPRKSDYIRIIR